MVLVSGEYIVYLNNKKVVLFPGDELYIPKGTEQWGECKAGTRSIHAFGGKRIKQHNQGLNADKGTHCQL
jgi:quercetin dioxygenase-like cupin family protein